MTNRTSFQAYKKKTPFVVLVHREHEKRPITKNRTSSQKDEKMTPIVMLARRENER